MTDKEFQELKITGEEWMAIKRSFPVYARCFDKTFILSNHNKSLDEVGWLLKNYKPLFALRFTTKQWEKLFNPVNVSDIFYSRYDSLNLTTLN